MIKYDVKKATQKLSLVSVNAAALYEEIAYLFGLRKYLRKKKKRERKKSSSFFFLLSWVYIKLKLRMWNQFGSFVPL